MAPPNVPPRPSPPNVAPNFGDCFPFFFLFFPPPNETGAAVSAVPNPTAAAPAPTLAPKLPKVEPLLPPLPRALTLIFLEPVCNGGAEDPVPKGLGAGGLAPKNKVRLESLSPVMAWTYKHNLLQQEAILESLERAQLYVHQASVAGVEDEQAGGAWPGFMPAFLDKGRQQDLVSRIPVKLVRRSQSCCKRGGGA